MMMEDSPVLYKTRRCGKILGMICRNTIRSSEQPDIRQVIT